jgi:hypothetical protein
MKRKVKSEEELLALFDDKGYSVYKGDWSIEDITFLENMFTYCDKELIVIEENIEYDFIMEESPYYSFMEEWLEPLEDFKGIDGAWDKDKTGIEEFTKPPFTVQSDHREMKAENAPIQEEEEEVDFSVSSICKDRLGEGKKSDWTKKHYDFKYTLTPEDIKKGEIVLDPWFIASQWKLSEKDKGSCLLFHSLKTIARFGEKNDPIREIDALTYQSEALKRFFK